MPLWNSVGESLVAEFDESVIFESFSMSDGKIKPSSLASAILITTVTDTSTVYIEATTKNPELSAVICNELCSRANKFTTEAITTEAIGIVEIKSIDTAKAYYTPVAPNIPKNTLIGLDVGFVLIIAIIF
ncbi:MAG: hypothetical protein LUG26_07155 [Ruminococcus sp.]|nr:hypothetical protein [Ruminococcus sp.]